MNTSDEQKWVNDVQRLRWQCRRGMLELDLILLAFLDRYYLQLSSEQKATFVALLKEPDPVLYAWLLGREQPPSPEFAVLVALMIEHTKTLTHANEIK